MGALVYLFFWLPKLPSTTVVLHGEADILSSKWTSHWMISLLKLLHRVSPAWRKKQKSLPGDCGESNNLAPLTPLASLPLLYCLAQTCTQPPSEPGILAVWFLMLSDHSGLNSNATSFTKVFSASSLLITNCGTQGDPGYHGVF